MQITVQVSAEVARALRPGGARAVESQELLQTVQDLGVELEPLHPDAKDPLLTPYFKVDVPDAATADRVLACLRQSAAIEAAYVKPVDLPP